MAPSMAPKFGRECMRDGLVLNDDGAPSPLGACNLPASSLPASLPLTLLPPTLLAPYLSPSYHPTLLAYNSAPV